MVTLDKILSEGWAERGRKRGEGEGEGEGGGGGGEERERERERETKRERDVTGVYRNYSTGYADTNKMQLLHQLCPFLYKTHTHL